MLAILERLFAGNSKSSRVQANQRLKTVLAQDRAGASAEMLESLKLDVTRVIAKHVEVCGQPRISLASDGRRTIIDINIHVKGRS